MKTWFDPPANLNALLDQEMKEALECGRQWLLHSTNDEINCHQHLWSGYGVLASFRIESQALSWLDVGWYLDQFCAKLERVGPCCHFTFDAYYNLSLSMKSVRMSSWERIHDLAPQIPIIKPVMVKISRVDKVYPESFEIRSHPIVQQRWP